MAKKVMDIYMRVSALLDQMITWNSSMIRGYIMQLLALAFWEKDICVTN